MGYAGALGRLIILVVEEGVEIVVCVDAGCGLGMVQRRWIARGAGPGLSISLLLLLLLGVCCGVGAGDEVSKVVVVRVVHRVVVRV